MTVAVLCALHILCAGILILLWKKHLLRVDAAALAGLLLIPFLGEASLVLLHFLHKTGGGKKASDLEVMRSDTVREGVYRRREDTGDESALPLEDVLILGSSLERHSAMMDVLLDSSGSSMRSLRQARENDDTEVVHYATTAMTQISREYDLKLQAAAAQLRKNPDSDVALNRYIDVLGQYLADSVPEGELLEVHRSHYRELLRRRIEKKAERADLAALAQSCLDSHLYEEADKAISALENVSLHWVRTLSLRLRYDYETGQGEALQALIRKVQKEKYYSEETALLIRFWSGNE